MQNHQNINADSGNTEYYTPLEIVEAARRTMGEIDLDPASSFAANQRIKCLWYFDIDNSGLTREWRGRVWLNHPFGKTTNKVWIAKLIASYGKGGGLSKVTEACCITFAATSEAWFRPLLAFPQCFLHGRTNYYLADGSVKKGATKGSCVTYLGSNVDAFAREFRSLGTVKTPYDYQLSK